MPASCASKLTVMRSTHPLPMCRQVFHQIWDSDRYVADYKALISALAGLSPPPKIILMTPPPVYEQPRLMDNVNMAKAVARVGPRTNCQS